MPSEMCHVTFMSHESLITVITSEGEVSCVPPTVSHQLVSVTKHLLTKFTSVPENFKLQCDVLAS